MAAAAASIAAEPFRQVCADAQALIAEHTARTGRRANIPLCERLDDAGCLQVIAARCNGRLQGYLVTVIAPSMEGHGQLSAAQQAIFSAAPGLGLRMQRASIAELRRRGVRELEMQTGPLGDAPRLGALYRRVGAERIGDVYRLVLGET